MSPAVVNSYNNLLLLQFESILFSFHSNFSLGLKPLVSLLIFIDVFQIFLLILTSSKLRHSRLSEKGVLKSYSEVISES